MQPRPKYDDSARGRHPWHKCDGAAHHFGSRTGYERAMRLATNAPDLMRCSWCGQPIDFGNAAVTISREIEQFERDGTITPIDSDGLITLCAGCGNRLNVDALRAALAGSDFRRPELPFGSRRRHVA